MTTPRSVVSPGSDHRRDPPAQLGDARNVQGHLVGPWRQIDQHEVPVVVGEGEDRLPRRRRRLCPDPGPSPGSRTRGPCRWIAPFATAPPPSPGGPSGPGGPAGPVPRRARAGPRDPGGRRSSTRAGPRSDRTCSFGADDAGIPVQIAVPVLVDADLQDGWTAVLGAGTAGHARHHSDREQDAYPGEQRPHNRCESGHRPPPWAPAPPTVAAPIALGSLPSASASEQGPCRCPNARGDAGFRDIRVVSGPENCPSSDSR